MLLDNMYRTFNKSTKNADGIDLKSILSETKKEEQKDSKAPSTKRSESHRQNKTLKFAGKSSVFPTR